MFLKLSWYIVEFLDYFCKDDTVVSRNTFLPLGNTERNETTWYKS